MKGEKVVSISDYRVWACDCGCYDGFDLHPDGDVICRACDALQIGVEFVDRKGSTMTVNEVRAFMIEKFDEDSGFEEAYIANIAMLLHDRYGITDYNIRNKAGKDVLDLIFRA